MFDSYDSSAPVPHDHGCLTGAPAVLQVVFVSDPALLPIMFDRALYPPNANILDRPVEEFLVQMDAVRTLLTHDFRRAKQHLHACCKRLFPTGFPCPFPAKAEMLHVQMTSDSGHSNLLTDKTGSDLWRLVRKGVAPAFNPQNIRSVSCCSLSLV